MRVGDMQVTLCGLGDEAGAALDDQILAHRELGWHHIELRTINGTWLADIDDDSFRRVRKRLSNAGLKASVVASRIGNWDRPITSPFELDVEELGRLAERVHALGGGCVRIMSYPNDGLAEPVWRERVISRIGKLADFAAREDIVLLNENCSGWAGSGWAQALTLIELVGSRALKVLFDTGNPIVHGYDGVQFLRRVRPWVAHVHIKDALNRGGRVEFTFPGMGQAHLPELISLLLANGYRGMFSIEPHLHLIPHLGIRAGRAQSWPAYVAFGRAFEALVGVTDRPTSGLKRNPLETPAEEERIDE